MCMMRECGREQVADASEISFCGMEKCWVGLGASGDGCHHRSPSEAGELSRTRGRFRSRPPGRKGPRYAGRLRKV